MRRLKTILFQLCVLLPVTLPAQNRIGNFMVFGEEDIPSFSNRKFFEDSRGFLWICTNNGLFRFDGFTFQPYYAYYDDSTSLNSNSVADVEEDADGNLWISTATAGVAKMNPFTGKIKQYSRLSHDENTIYAVNDIFRDASNELWFATGGRGIAHYLPAKDSFEIFVLDPDRIHDGSARFQNEIWEFAADPVDDNILWAAGLEGLYRFNKSSKTSEKFEYLINGEKNWIDNSFHCIYLENLHHIWLGTWGGGLVKFDYSTRSFEHFLPSPAMYTLRSTAHNIILDILSETGTSLYICSSDGSFLSFDKIRRKFSPLLSPGPSSLDRSRCYTVTRTSDGSVWAGGENYILHRHPLYDRFGQSIDLSPFAESEKMMPEFTDVVYDSARSKYLVSVLRKGAILELNQDMSISRWIPFLHPQPANGIVNIALDNRGRLYAAATTYPYLLYRNPDICCLEPVAGNLIAKDKIPKEFAIRVMKFDGNSRIWIAYNNNKLLRWNIEDGSIRTFNISTDPASGISAERVVVISMALDSKGNPWLTSNNGLFYFDDQTGIFEHYFSRGTTSPGDFATSYLNIVSIDRRQRLWVNPRFQGVQVFDPVKKEIIQNYSIGRGTYSNHIDAMTRDREDNLWCTSGNGLLQFNSRSRSWRVFTARDGLPRNSLVGCVEATTNGNIFLGIDASIIIFNPLQLKENTKKPVMYITAFEVAGKEFFSDTLPAYKKNIRLTHRQNEIMIAFTGIEMLFPDKLKFFYRLLGSDTTWKSIETRQISFSNMQPGQYTFEVKAINSDGYESVLPGSISFTVLRPYWQKAWFIILCIVAGLALLYLIYRVRINQILKIQQVKNKISADLHDDIGSRLTNIQLLTQISKNQDELNESTVQHLNHIQEEVHASAEALDEIVTNIRSGDDQAEDIGVKMRHYAAQAFDMSTAELEIKVAEDLVSIKINDEKRRDLFQVFKEAINNIRKHARAAHVSIQIGLQEKNIHLLVKDNGRGFDTSAQTSRNGLRIMKERAQKWNGKVHVTSHPNHGTCIEVIFPPDTVSPLGGIFRRHT